MSCGIFPSLEIDDDRLECWVEAKKQRKKKSLTGEDLDFLYIIHYGKAFTMCPFLFYFPSMYFSLDLSICLELSPKYLLLLQLDNTIRVRYIFHFIFHYLNTVAYILVELFSSSLFAFTIAL